MLQNVKIDQPLAVIDVETTGVEDYDRIVQVAVVRFEPNGAITQFVTLVNPGCPIPPEATEVHGISDEDVRDAPTFREIAPELAIHLQDARWCGYNVVRFDIPMLMREYDRAGSRFPHPCGPTIDVYQLYQQLEPRDLGTVHQRVTGVELSCAHDAMADVLGTARVLDAIVGGYELDPSLDAIHEQATPPPDTQFVDSERKFRWRFGEPIFTFGKLKGKTLRSVARDDRGYLEWMLRQDYSDEVKEIVRGALDGRIPRRPVPEQQAAQGSLV